jgi:hypothetical protein
LIRKQSQRGRGKSPNRGRGITGEKFHKFIGEAGGYKSQKERGGYSKGKNPFQEVYEEPEEEN